MSPTAKVLSASVSSTRVFQKRMLSGNPPLPRGPGRSSRKKSASCASNDLSPFGTILMRLMSEDWTSAVVAEVAEEPERVADGTCDVSGREALLGCRESDWG